MTGTLFEKSTTPLTLWFHAIFIFSNAKSGISAKEMERQLGVTYKTAWRILKLIRSSLKQSDKKLKGDVEMDEGFIGGRFRSGKGNKKRIEAAAAKSVVIGAVERGGEIRVKTAQTASSITIGRFLEENVEKENTRLLTDESNRYDRVARSYYRLSVNHSREEFARGDVHINTLESFWGHIKKSITGTHKVISKKHLQSYLDGFVFHYNNRHSDRERFSVLLGAVLQR
jgi:transposase-like protein